MQIRPASLTSTVVAALLLSGCGSADSTGVTAAQGDASLGTAPSTDDGGASICPLPSKFKWKDSGGPIAQPSSGWQSLKDFTNVVYNGQHLIYMTMHSGSAYGSAFMSFTDWADAAEAVQIKMPTSTVAPTLFYFRPKQQWFLAYQWCSAKFCYATSSDPTGPTSWSPEKSLLTEDITSATYGPIDQTVICDSTDCYLFYAADNGKIYRASMPIGSFPDTFTGSTMILSDTTQNLFEAVQVYAIKGASQYLMIVEAQGSRGRYFRAFTASSLGGTFAAIAGASNESSPFAGKNNVAFDGSAWTNDVSHGDLVRANPDETATVDPCNLQFLYQGRDPSSSGTYDELPYRPGLLTLVQ
jgi:hypothetical protein